MSEHGWGAMEGGTFRMQFAIDIARALACAILNTPERIILQFVQEESWNAAITRKVAAKDPWPDPLPCIINVSAIANLTKCDRSNLSRAKASLLEDGILMPLGDGVTINKNVDTWADSRITRDRVEFARSGKLIKHPRAPKAGKGVVDPPRHGVADPPQSTVVDPPQCTVFSVVDPPQGCGRSATGGVVDPPHPASDAVVSKTGAPIRAGEEDFSSLPELNSNSNSLLTTSPVMPALKGTVVEVEREKYLNLIPENPEQISRWAAHVLGPGVLPEMKIRALCSRGPALWVYEALSLAVLGTKDPEKVWAYARTCIEDWRKKGEMDLDGARAGLKASAPAVKPNTHKELMAGFRRHADKKKLEREALKAKGEANGTGG